MNSGQIRNGECGGERHPWHKLTLENVTLRRGRQLIIDQISFSLDCGDIVALIGPNGGGKSSLLKVLLGEWPYQGKIFFTDHSGCGMPRPRIGYMPQHLHFDRRAPLTVADLFCAHHGKWPVFLGNRRKTCREIEKILDLVDASHLLYKQLGELSGGELQRVTLSFALDPIPDILLLDEPVSALDETGKARFYQLVSDLREKYDLLTLIVSHELDVITSYANRIIYLNQKIIAEGPVEEIMTANPPWMPVLNQEKEKGGS